MVGAILPATFTHDELLAGRLAGCAILGLAASVSRVRLVMSRRTSYRFVNSGTGDRSGVEVV